MEDKILDVCKPEECQFHVLDSLEHMFDLQKKMQMRVKAVELPAMRPDLIPMAVTSIVAELGEVLEDQQAWKDWKQNPAPVDVAHMRMEVADLWHFVINFTLACDMDAEDVYAEFLDKNAVNHKRQDESY